MLALGRSLYPIRVQDGCRLWVQALKGVWVLKWVQEEGRGTQFFPGAPPSEGRGRSGDFHVLLPTDTALHIPLTAGELGAVHGVPSPTGCRDVPAPRQSKQVGSCSSLTALWVVGASGPFKLPWCSRQGVREHSRVEGGAGQETWPRTSLEQGPWARNIPGAQAPVKGPSQTRKLLYFSDRKQTLEYNSGANAAMAKRGAHGARSPGSRERCETYL